MNELRNNNFTMTFEKLPNVAFYGTDVPVPAVNLGEAIANFRTIDVYIPSDKLDFDPMTITFNVNENLENYLEVFNWMMDLGHPNRDKVDRPDDRDATSDCIITILNNQKNPIYNIVLKDCFPTSLGELALSTAAAEVTICTITLRYSFFEIVSLKS